MKQFELKIFTTLDQLDELRQPWNELLDSCLRPTVFDSWEWQYLCARFFASEGKLSILAVYDDDTPVGILPLRQCKTRIGGLISTKVWRCLGGGITDYNALIIREKQLSSVIPAYADFLRQSGLPINLDNVLPGSPLDILSRYLKHNRYRKAVYESKTALVSRLTGDYDSFLKSRKQKFRRTMNNNRNYIERAGGYSYHKESASSDLLTDLIRLHTARWEHKGEGGALAKKRITDFHTALQDMNDRSFDIQYYTIRHEGKVIAILYGFILGDRYYAYLSGFDMEHNRISPGNMVFEYCIRDLIDKGIRVFDMLRGDMKYKQTWATISYDMVDTFYFPPTISARLLYYMLKTVQAVKRMLPSSLKKGLKSLSRRGSSEGDSE